MGAKPSRGGGRRQAHTYTPAVSPGLAERTQMRRRARYLRQLRELQLRDIGGFVVELHRFGRQQPDLVQEKVLAAAQTHTELRSLEDALEENTQLGEVRKAGIGGACSQCGTVHGSSDRFCAWCGHQL
jgi:hypothetical protein